MQSQRATRRLYLIGWTWVLVGAILFAFSGSAQTASKSPQDFSPSPEDYILIGWNDLGMHCINPTFRELAILPPANNLWAQVIQKGNPPKVVTSGVTLEYSIVNNTTVVGKTDFWLYVKALFGIDLSEGIGLTGNGLSGRMQPVGDHFEATKIPVLPYDDQMRWNPYQTAVVKLKKDGSEKVLKTTKVILPVSDELNCAKCHAQGMDGTIHITDTGTVEGNILAVHDYYQPALTLYQNRPVLCAGCHADNALGASGNGISQKSLSQAMHAWHAPFPDAGCYDCHPGQMTQCLRTGIGGMGYSGDVPSCQSGLCHGGMQDIADSIALGREPWLQEPTCEQCHGPNKSTGQDLYRNSKGTSCGLYCAACHNSPHVWWPSKLLADNKQPLTLQRRASSTGNCLVCHLTKPNGNNTNPHVTRLTAPDIITNPDSLDFASVRVRTRKTKQIVITNRGTTDLKITGLEITGSDASMFRVVDSNPITLRPGGTYPRIVAFRPSSIGVKTATLNINSDDPDTPILEVQLEGTAL